MGKNIFLAGVLSFLFAINAFAEREQFLVLVHGEDLATSSAQLFVVWSDDAAQLLGMRVKRDNRVEDYSLDQLLDPGVVLLQKSKAFITKDILQVRLEDFTTPQADSTIVLTVLREYGFFSDDYRKLKMKLHVQGPGAGGVSDVPLLYEVGFNLKSLGFQKINRLFMRTLMQGGDAVGIGSVEAFWEQIPVVAFGTDTLPQAAFRRASMGIKGFLKRCRNLL